MGIIKLIFRFLKQDLNYSKQKVWMVWKSSKLVSLWIVNFKLLKFTINFAKQVLQKVTFLTPFDKPCSTDIGRVWGDSKCGNFTTFKSYYTFFK